MKHTTKVIVLCLVVALAAFGIWSSLYSSSSRHQSPWRVHDANNGFSIVPPPGWTSREAATGNFMTYHGPKEGGFPVSFNVNVHEDKSNAIPEQMLLGVKQLLTRVMTNYRAVEEDFEIIDGKRCYSLCGTFEMGRFKLQSLQYGIPTEAGKIYNITFTAPQDVFDKYRPRFEQTAVSARMD